MLVSSDVRHPADIHSFDVIRELVRTVTFIQSILNSLHLALPLIVVFCFQLKENKSDDIVVWRHDAD
ncbi:hypothetical protein DTO271D3_7167 [Paecilomyces variotii]|nr:hypothetical protein DTO271D3_7167 [Paecilomyces variotii]